MRNAIIAVVVIAGGYFLLTSDGGSNLLSTSGNGGIPDFTTTPTTSSSGVQVYSGDLTMSTKTTDTTDPATTYGGDTELTTVCYKDNGSADEDNWTPIATGSSAETEALTIPVTSGSASENGLTYIRCGIAIGSTQDYYVDVNKLQSGNPRISEVTWQDANQDNIKEVVYKLDLLDISPPDPNTTPTHTVFYRLIDEGSLDLDDPTKVTSAGTGSAENRIKWSMDMDNAGDGEAVSRLEITLNSTDDTQWFENLSYINMPNFGQIYLTEMDRTDLASTTVYRYDFGTDAHDSLFLVTPKNGDTENDSHVVIQSNFDASNEGLCVELEIRTVDAQGAYTTNNDDVSVLEASAGSDCSV